MDSCVICPYVEACCRLNECFPHLRPLWHRLWYLAIRHALRN
jgi:hypothetical protein